ncbi:MAG: hypothetical protein ACYS8Z_05365 [Planctomycetota bacterium]
MRSAFIKYALLMVLAVSIVPTYGAENASNPLASVNNTDFRWQYFDLDGPERNDIYLDGAYMLHPKLKLKYELHYWHTDVTGSDENDFESLHIKPIYFPKQGKWCSYKYKSAIGLEWIEDFDNRDKGIGTGSDIISPFVGIALMKGDTILIPLVQHFTEYSGPTVNQTAFRLIALKKLPRERWLKLDAKLPVDWENDNDIPATFEAQLGKSFTPSFGIYLDGLVGIGGHKPYEWGVGIGLRYNY